MTDFWTLIKGDVTDSLNGILLNFLFSVREVTMLCKDCLWASRNSHRYICIGNLLCGGLSFRHDRSVLSLRFSLLLRRWVILYRSILGGFTCLLNSVNADWKLSPMNNSSWVYFVLYFLDSLFAPVRPYFSSPFLASPLLSSPSPLLLYILLLSSSFLLLSISFLPSQFHSIHFNLSSCNISITHC